MKNPLITFTYKILLLVICTSLLYCKGDITKESSNEATEKMTPATSISKSPYGTTTDGRKIEQYILKNENGMTVEVITYGGIITKWTAPDKNGNFENIVLGYDSLAQYVKGSPYFGALIGRYGNRIAKGKFSIDGEEYTLATNDGPNHLHGGVLGFDKVIWTANEIQTEHGAALKLTYLSKDKEEGYPGNLKTTVIYELTKDNALEVSYEATTDKATVVNLSQHSYFNLSGDFSQNILDHELMIEADAFLPVDATLIPIGEIRPVLDTPFDFRKPKLIGKDIEMENDQLIKGKGYDHCWVLNEEETLRKVASAYHAPSGRLLEVSTDEPAIQFYCGNFLDGTLPAPNGGTYGHRSGFCLETQHYPDAPNQADFPSVLLKPGERYTSKTVFKFSVK